MRIIPSQIKDILTTCESSTSPPLLSKLAAKGIEKFIAYEIPIDLDCFATRLGGPDRRSLFLCMAKWLGPDKIDEAVEQRTGQVRVVEAPAPGVGWP